MNHQSEASTSAHNALERKKSNLAFAFFCMDKDRARDMEIFYAFCRLMDDIADDPSTPADEKIKALENWKAEIETAYNSGEKISALGEEMRSLVRRRGVPKNYVLDIIDGVLRDTSPAPFETFADVKKYCYGVASAVGLVSIYIFGFKNPVTKQFAESLGYALQFTNILRDVVDDIRTQNRVYIPEREMRFFGIRREDLKNPAKNPACRELFSLMYFRAKHFFNKSRRLIAEEDRKCLAPAFIMWAIYEDILERLRARNFDIPAKPLKISKARKIYLALHAVRRAKKTRTQCEPPPRGKAAVIGAGVAGICAALNLAREGFETTLFEARKSVFGRTAKIEFSGAELDNAAHAAMGCYKNFFAPFGTFGIGVSEYFKAVDTMLFASKDGRSTLLKFPEETCGLMSALKTAREYLKLESVRNAKNIFLLLGIKFGLKRIGKNQTAAEMLAEAGIKTEAIAEFWEPFCVSTLNTTLKNASARLLASTLKKSVLSFNAADARLMLPAKPCCDAFWPRAQMFLEAAEGEVRLGTKVVGFNTGDNAVIGVETSSGNSAPCDYAVSAIPPHDLEALCGQNLGDFSETLSALKTRGITNIYFTTPQKLFDADCACPKNSAIHWVFNHTQKLPAKGAPLHLYSATISDTTVKLDKPSAVEFLKTQLAPFFGEFEISDALPSHFGRATLSADPQTEALRPAPDAAKKRMKNLLLAGDWTSTELPCTLESAAKSASLGDFLKR